MNKELNKEELKELKKLTIQKEKLKKKLEKIGFKINDENLIENFNHIVNNLDDKVKEKSIKLADEYIELVHNQIASIGKKDIDIQKVLERIKLANIDTENILPPINKSIDVKFDDGEE